GARAAVLLAQSPAAPAGSLAVSHRRRPRWLRVLARTRPFDRDGLRSGGGGDRFAAVLVVLGRRRQGPLPRTGLLRPPGRRISGGGRLPAGGAAPAATWRHLRLRGGHAGCWVGSTAWSAPRTR